MVHQWKSCHEEVLLRAHIRVNFRWLMIARMEHVWCMEALGLSVSTIYAAGLARELSIRIGLYTKRLLAVLLQQSTLIAHVFLGYELNHNI